MVQEQTPIGTSRVFRCMQDLYHSAWTKWIDDEPALLPLEYKTVVVCMSYNEN